MLCALASGRTTHRVRGCRRHVDTFVVLLAATSRLRFFSAPFDPSTRPRRNVNTFCYVSSGQRSAHDCPMSGNCPIIRDSLV
eukprot:6203598-Pyramimonas_sp.AAC.1